MTSAGGWNPACRWNAKSRSGRSAWCSARATPSAWTSSPATASAARRTTTIPPPTTPTAKTPYIPAGKWRHTCCCRSSRLQKNPDNKPEGGKRRKPISRLVVAALLASAALVQAQNFPNRPIRIIVPFAAGGPTDTHSRWGAQHLTAALGQQVLIDNRGGAGGIIGTEAVAKAAPDGYTLLGGNPGPLTIAPSVRKKLAYDTARDFAPI